MKPAHIATLLTVPLLFLTTACENSNEPTKGRVIDKEYVAGQVCTPSKKKACASRPECYSLEILTDHTGEIVEVCDKAAYEVLNVEDRYSSAIDYSREEH
jgi:hypothetical protein